MSRQRRDIQATLLARAGQHPHVRVALEQRVVVVVHVEQSERGQSVGNAGRLGQVPEPAERPGQALDRRVVGRIGAFAQREQAAAHAVIGLEAFRVDDPVLPADVREVQHQSLHAALVHARDRDRITGVHGLRTHKRDRFVLL